MASIQPKFGYPGLRITYSVSAAVLGGRLVELTGNRIVGPAGAGSTKVVGVAQWDVPTTRTSIQGPQVGDGSELTVLNDCVVPLVASGAIAAGDELVAGAAGVAVALAAVDNTNAGTVATGVSGTRAVIGRALEAAVDGATFLARVNV